MKLNWILGFIFVLIGLGITIGISYYVAWTVPWLLIFLGFYFLGIAIAWAWENWTGFDDYWALLIFLIGFVLGLAMVGNVSTLLTKGYCYYPPCVPMFWPLLVLLIGNLVYVLGDRAMVFNKARKKD